MQAALGLVALGEQTHAHLSAPLPLLKFLARDSCTFRNVHAVVPQLVVGHQKRVIAAPYNCVEEEIVVDGSVCQQKQLAAPEEILESGLPDRARARIAAGGHDVLPREYQDAPALLSEAPGNKGDIPRIEQAVLEKTNVETINHDVRWPSAHAKEWHMSAAARYSRPDDPLPHVTLTSGQAT